MNSFKYALVFLEHAHDDGGTLRRISAPCGRLREGTGWVGCDLKSRSKSRHVSVSPPRRNGSDQRFERIPRGLPG